MHVPHSRYRYRYTAIVTGGEIATPVYSHPYLLLVVHSLNSAEILLFDFPSSPLLSSSPLLFSSPLLLLLFSSCSSTKKYQKVQVRRLVCT